MAHRLLLEVELDLSCRNSIMMNHQVWLKDAFFTDTKTGINFSVQSLIFPTQCEKTIVEFVHRCRLLKTENDCYCTLKMSEGFVLIWDSTSVKEKIMLSSETDNTVLYFSLSSDELNLQTITG